MAARCQNVAFESSGARRFDQLQKIASVPASVTQVRARRPMTFQPKIRPMPRLPHYTLPIDWNRHARKVGPKASEQSINVLFCDGHAATLSARETYRAIRFK